MKVNAIVRIIIYSLVLLILVGILGGVLYRAEHRADRASVSASSAEQGAQRYHSDTLQTFSPDRITDLEIEWVTGDIRILASDDISEIRIQEEAVSDPKYQMRCRVSEETLSIQFSEDDHITIGFGIHSDDVVRKDLTIEVPAGWFCHELEIDTAASNLEVHNLAIGTVDYDGASGICDFQNCQVQNLDLDTASGDVTFTGTLNSLDFDAASASFTGQFQNTPSRIDMDGMSGDLNISLPEDCGYSVRMEGMSSSFHTDFQETKYQNGMHIYGDGSCRITVDGMSCDVTIRKLS